MAAAAAAVAVIGGISVVAPSAGAAPKSPPHKVNLPSTARTWQTGKTAKTVKAPAKNTPATIPWAVAKNGEISALRTGNSSTFTQPNGQLKTVVSTVPTHIKDSAGNWQNINTNLTKATNGTLSPADDGVSVSLPADLSDPVRASTDAASVSSTLPDADPVSPTVAGSTATYADAFPGTDVVYTVQATGVKEEFVLADKNAPASYTEQITLGAGQTLKANSSRGLDILDVDGSVAGQIPAPVMTDSSKNPSTDASTGVHYEVSGTGPAYTITIAADQDWLKDPGRVFPVRIDPTVTFGTTNDLGCYIVPSGADDAPGLCSTNTGTDNDLKFGNSAYERHALLRFGEFDLSNTPIPGNAVIDKARLDMTVHSSNDTTTPMLSSVYRVTQDFTSAATWTDSGTGSWTAGGAFGPTAVDTLRFTPTSDGQVVSFYPTRLVDGWVSGRYSNQGLGLRLDPTSTSTNTVAFYGIANAAHHPTLTIDWSPNLGQQSWVGAYDHQLTDRMDVHVDYGSRNLVLNNTDETMTAPGQALTVRRTYNSIQAAAGSSKDFGAGWVVNGGTDVSLDINRAAVVVNQPGGAQAVFFRNFDQSDTSKDDAYVDAPGLNATLTMPDSTHYKLRFHKTRIIDTFTLPAAGADHANLTSVQDRNHLGTGTATGTGGNTTNWTVDGTGKTTKVTDTTGNRSVNFTYTGTRITSAAETLNGGSAGRDWGYAYDGSGHLTTYTDPAGKQTKYCYTGNLITTIISPRGVATGATCTSSSGNGITKISYDTTGKVTSITYVNSADSTVQKLTFSQVGTIRPNGTAVARVLDPYSQESAYRFDTRDRITSVTNPLGDPRSTTYSTNDDVTAAVSANNYSGSGSDPSTSAQYDPDNNRTSVTLPSGASTGADYDISATSKQPFLPISGTDDVGKQTTYENGTGTDSLDGGQVTKATLNSNSVINRYQSQTNVPNCGPSGAAAYKGALCETRDPDYNATTSTAEHRIKYSYNAMGEAVSVTPAQPNHGRSTPPAVTASYDGYSHRTDVTDSKGQHTHYDFDLLDRPTKITYADGSSTTYVYNEDGDRTSATEKNSSGTVTHTDTYGYDANNRMISQTTTGTGLAVNATMGYDANSRLIAYTDDGGTVTYGYDIAGGLTSIADPGGDCTGADIFTPPPASSLCTLFALDRSGNRVLTIYPGDISELGTDYNSSGQVIETRSSGVISGVRQDLIKDTYSYTDTSGGATAHITKRVEAGPGRTVTFTYDNSSRLGYYEGRDSSSNALQNATRYCYDKASNISSTANGSTSGCPTAKVFTIDGANQLLTAAVTGQPTTNYSYDLNGDATGWTFFDSSPGTSYTYNDRGQMTGVTSAGNDPVTLTYAGPTNDQLLTVASGTMTKSLANGPLGISAISTDDGSGAPTDYITRDPSGNLVSYRPAGGGHQYYLTGLQSSQTVSVQGVINDDGTHTAFYHYEGYGQLTSNSDTDSPAGPFRFIGQLDLDSLDPAIHTGGLTHLGARYYNPELGRFTQTDPLTHTTNPNTANPYTYTGGDPINLADPSGQFSLGDAFKVGGAVLGVASIPFTGGLGIGLAAAAVGLDVTGGVLAGDSAGEIASSAAVGVAGLGLSGAVGALPGSTGVAETVVDSSYEALGLTTTVCSTFC